MNEVINAILFLCFCAFWGTLMYDFDPYQEETTDSYYDEDEDDEIYYDPYDLSR